eukprot:1947922-Amphidinium_carterae.1
MGSGASQVERMLSHSVRAVLHDQAKWLCGLQVCLPSERSSEQGQVPGVQFAKGTGRGQSQT